MQMIAASPIQVELVRRHFLFPGSGRVVTNNAASTQPPRELVDMFRTLSSDYENVHRGQSAASQLTTGRFERAYDTIAQFINAPSRADLVVTRNTTEAHNIVMYSLLTDFRPGDNVVTTMMEHNSNYVPWYGLCREILAKLGRPVEYRIARFDPETGELDYAHLASLIDRRTKIVCCTGASNFLGTKNRLAYVRDLASHSGYVQPDDRTGSYLLVDAAQLVPSTFVDVQQMDVDFLSFSFHKLLAPFGAGVLYGKHRLLESMRPFMYGGDMVAVGGVAPDHVDYNELPWKFAAGTPNILGTIVSSQALRLLIDLALSPEQPRRFLDERPLRRDEIRDAMSRIADYTRVLTDRAMNSLRRIPGLRIYGPPDPERRTSLVAFNIEGCDPIALAEGLSARGVECRAGCHCATLAHRFLDLNPPASCRLSFYFYNTPDEVDRATDAVVEVAGIIRGDRRATPAAILHRRPIA